MLVADDPTCDGQAWLRRAQEFERDAGRIRGERWGPRTLDVDLIACHQSGQGRGAPEKEVIARDSNLTLPHPMAHLRAFVMVPWLDLDPEAELTLTDGTRPIAALLAELDPADREGVRLYERTLES